MSPATARRTIQEVFHSDDSVAPPQSLQTTRATELYDGLLRRFRREGKYIDVSFRELVGPIPLNDYTHSIAPYPGRLLRQIPRFFLHCEQIARPGDVVLDPFCGSGTVLVEARAARMDSWGIDQNPYARLLSRVKTTPLNYNEALDAAQTILRRAKRLRSGEPPDVVNIDIWYSEQVRTRLSRLRRAIFEAGYTSAITEYLLLCLVLTADKCSLRDPRIPVPVRRRDWRDIIHTQHSSAVWDCFDTISSHIGVRLSNLATLRGVTSIVLGGDACSASETYVDSLAEQIKRPSVILTSPPYGAAQKYIRSSSLALGWTGLAGVADLAELERGCVGREHLRKHEYDNLDVPDESIALVLRELATRDRLRAAIYAEYFRLMDRVFCNLAEVLASGGYLILVAGSNIVAGKSLSTHSFLHRLAMRYGLVTELELRDTIRGRVLLTKRASASEPLKFESVHVLRKVAE